MFRNLGSGLVLDNYESITWPAVPIIGETRNGPPDTANQLWTLTAQGNGGYYFTGTNGDVNIGWDGTSTPGGTIMTDGSVDWYVNVIDAAVGIYQ